ncbi:unnamed protein product, partial [Allacma fusca]
SSISSKLSSETSPYRDLDVNVILTTLTAVAATVYPTRKV